MFINMPMAEARDFHCYSHVFENLGKRSIPSDHAAVRVVSQKRTVRANNIQLGMSKHPVFCSILKRLDDDHQYPADPFGALADFKTVVEKAKRQTVRELSGKTPDSLGGQAVDRLDRFFDLIEIGILERSCDVVRRGNPLGNASTLFPLSALISMGSARLLRTSLVKILQNEKRKFGTSLGHRRRKTLLWQSVGLDFEHGAPRNLCFVFTLLLMKTVILWKTKRNLAEGSVSTGVRFSKHAPKVEASPI